MISNVFDDENVIENSPIFLYDFPNQDIEGYATYFENEITAETVPSCSEVNYRLMEEAEIICMESEDLLFDFDLLICNFDLFKEKYLKRLYLGSIEESYIQIHVDCPFLIHAIDTMLKDFDELIKDREILMNNILEEGNSFLKVVSTTSEGLEQPGENWLLSTDTLIKTAKVLSVLTQRILIDHGKHLRFLRYLRNNAENRLKNMFRKYEASFANPHIFRRVFNNEQNEIYFELQHIYSNLFEYKYVIRNSNLYYGILLDYLIGFNEVIET